MSGPLALSLLGTPGCGDDTMPGSDAAVDGGQPADGGGGDTGGADAGPPPCADDTQEARKAAPRRWCETRWGPRGG